MSDIEPLERVADVPPLSQKTSIVLKFKKNTATATDVVSAVGEETRIRGCLHCGVCTTPQWREGPLGPKTLCNKCGVRYKAKLWKSRQKTCPRANDHVRTRSQALTAGTPE